MRDTNAVSNTIIHSLSPRDRNSYSNFWINIIIYTVYKKLMQMDFVSNPKAICLGVID